MICTDFVKSICEAPTREKAHPFWRGENGKQIGSFRRKKRALGGGEDGGLRTNKKRRNKKKKREGAHVVNRGEAKLGRALGPLLI